MSQRPVQIRLRLDNNGIPTVADGSDMVTAKRLNNSRIRFDIEGEVRVTTAMLYEGTLCPFSGELEFETVANPNKGLYSENESKFLNIEIKPTDVRGGKASKWELEKENERLRRQANEYHVKEVGEQQTLFGKGIND